MLTVKRIRLPGPLLGAVILAWIGELALAADGNIGLLQSHTSILDAARLYAIERAAARHDRVVANPGALDSRLRLARCEQPLNAFAAPGGKLSGKITVGVRCDGPKPWSLYVPVQVSIPGKAAVAVRDSTRSNWLLSISPSTSI